MVNQTAKEQLIANYFDRERINAAKEYLSGLMVDGEVPHTLLTKADICAQFCHTFLSKSGAPGVRKHNGEPYINHPRRVSATVMEAINDEVAGATALLHDVLEDTFLTYEELKKYFGEEIATLVQWLTNEKQPGIPRNIRKHIEETKTLYMPVRAKNVRCGDILDNTTDLQVMEPEFARLYLFEKRELFHSLASSGSVTGYLVADDVLLKKLYTRLFVENRAR